MGRGIPDVLNGFAAPLPASFRGLGLRVDPALCAAAAAAATRLCVAVVILLQVVLGADQKYFSVPSGSEETEDLEIQVHVARVGPGALLEVGQFLDERGLGGVIVVGAGQRDGRQTLLALLDGQVDGVRGGLARGEVGVDLRPTESLDRGPVLGRLVAAAGFAAL